jgi:hypothetical protein
MQYFILIPTSYGELRENAAASYLLLDRLPIDDVMSISGGNVFISSFLANRLLQSSLTGYELGDVETRMGDQFRIAHPTYNSPLPRLRWLKIAGVLAKDDFCRHKNFMAISERALNILNGFRIDSCRVFKAEEFPSKWEDQKRLLFEKAKQELKGMIPKQFPPDGGR